MNVLPPSSTSDQLFVISHPLVQHTLTLMRKKETSNSDFRRLLFELSQLMAYEITRDTPLQLESIQTPLESLSSPIIDAKKWCW